MNRKRILSVAGIALAIILASSYVFYANLLSVPDLGKREEQSFSLSEMISEVSEQRIMSHINILASAEYQGRLAGDTGQYKAAEYIASQFDSYGLKRVADGDTYYQWFTYPFWRATIPTRFGEIDGENRVWTITSEFTVFLYSGAGNVSGQVIFAGYGITLPAKQYDDYSAIDVRGKIVLVFRHGPNGDQSWHNQYGVWSFGYKVRNAFDHGAIGLILVNRYTQPSEPGTGTLTAQGHIDGFPAVWADRSIAEYLMTETGKSLSDLQKSIDQQLKPSSMNTKKRVNIVVTTEFDPQRRTMNVIGAIEGQDPQLKNEVIIISAHYDHLGTSPSGDIYYGADDDASGTAGVLEAARVLSKYAPQAKYARTILFAAWSAEEEGLIGSSQYVSNPIFPIARTVAVIQLDMIGIGNGSGLLVFNGKNAVSITQRLTEAGKLVGVDIIPEDSASNSDHAPFAQRGVDAVLLYTEGSHPNYHTPNDRAEFIDSVLAQKVTRLVVVASWSLATGQAISITTTSVAPILKPVLVTAAPRRLI